MTFTSDFAPGTLSPPVCDGALCVYPVSSTTESANLFRGRWIAVGGGAPRPGGGYSGLSFRLFSGELEGCGAGTLMMEESIVTDDGVALRGEWRIIAGSGTDALAGVTGGGTFVGTQHPDGSGQVEGTGTIDC